MKILFAAHASHATAFALAPLAHAAKSQGHRVVMAGSQQTVPAITASGLPAFACTDRPLSEFILLERDGTPVAPADGDAGMIFNAGRFFGRYAATTLSALTELSEHFRPDLVVGGSLSFAAPLLAAALDVPYVRQTWDMYEIAPYFAGAEHELAPELAAAGLRGLPTPCMTLDVTLPSLATRHDDSPHQPLRFVPANIQTVFEPWMVQRSGRPRVCVTMGSRVQLVDTYDTSFKKLCDLITALAGLDVEILVAAPERVAAQVGPLIPVGHAGFIPLDIVAPSCDVVVHHAGGVSSLTALDAGTPQVMLPDAEIWERTTKQIEALGAGVSVPPGEAVIERAVAACRTVLEDNSFQTAAGKLRDEIRSMPHPFEQVAALELARRNHR
ncbi:glycosyltransferase [Nocardia sp. 004]|uniref:glycosyltransferase n=1 Tax=Nocardia sp. 004 TaxID=3385978 RepID=UPI0039A0D1E4